MDTNSTFSARLKEVLETKRVRQAELSRMTGITEGQITRYLKGKHKPTMDKVVKISQVMNVDTAYLLGYDVPMEEEKPEHRELRERIKSSLLRCSNDELLKIITYMEDIGIK